MISYLADIGFTTRGDEEFHELSRLAYVKSKEYGMNFKLKKISFEYGQWIVGNGIEFWTTFNPDNMVLECFTPYYSSKNYLTLTISRENTDEDCEFHRGFYARKNDGTPIIFDMPDSYITRPLVSLDKEYQVEICAFTELLEYYSNEDDYEEKSTEKLATNYYIPCGTFNPRKDLNFKQTATVMMAGKILSNKIVTNPFTDKEFYHFVIDNYFGKMSVIAPVSLINNPCIGGVIDGQFWVVGKVQIIQNL